MVPELVRNDIANCLDRALREVMDPSVEHIAPINTIGCFLLKHVTGANFKPVAGSLTVDTGAGFVARRADPERLDEHRYYVWSEAECETGAVGLVDFGARYWPAWAKAAGVEWKQDDLPFVWGPKAEAPELARYEAHNGITEAVRNAINAAVMDDKSDASAMWQHVINQSIDYMMKTNAGLDWLVQQGIAEATS